MLSDSDMKNADTQATHFLDFPTDKTEDSSGTYFCMGFTRQLPKDGGENLSSEELLGAFSTYLSRYSDSSPVLFNVWESHEWRALGCELDNCSSISEQGICSPQEGFIGKGIAVGIALDPLVKESLHENSIDFAIDVSNVNEVSVFFALDKFLPEAIKHRGHAFASLLDSVLENRELPAGKHSIATKIDADFVAGLSQSGNHQEYDLDTPVFMAFRQQVQRTPDAEAIRFQNRVITYRQLDDQSSQLAHYLLSQGACSGSSIGIYLERSEKAVIAMLAVQKLGGVYIPLDPGYPIDRIDYIAKDSGLNLLVTESSLANQISLTDIDFVLLDEVAEDINTYPLDLPEASVDGDSRIYSIYTSGSTGKPKGVGVRHRNVSLYLHSQNDVLGIENNKRVLALASFCFDVSTAEIYCTLLTGGCVVMATRMDATNPVALASLIKKQTISLMHATPSSWRLLLESGWKGQDLVAITAGEPFPRELIKPLTDVTRELWNFYGPTETTVYATCYEIAATDDFVHIGTPMPGYRVEVCDESGLPTPLGATGELWIGGLGVVDGYVNRTDLNSVQFSGTGAERFYRTGDAVRLHANGFIEYFSRIDGQVKVNGYRIELGEIEAVLSEHPTIQRSVGGVQIEGLEKQLVMWYVTNVDDKPAPVDLKEFLGSRLPAYMIPTAWKEVDHIPLNPNGKVDRKSLPKIGQSHQETTKGSGPTQHMAVEDLLRIAKDLWLEILDLKTDDRKTSFFEAGGTSMLALNYINRLNQLSSKTFSIVDLFTHPTLGEWEKFIGSGFEDRATTQSAKRESRKSGKDIAIVGMAVHVPGAKNVSDFWENILGGHESISHFSQDELALELPESVTSSPSYVPYRGILEDYDAFDDRFFGMSPREAKVTDPQHRLFLQTAWHALEDSGHVASKSSELVGVYAGSYYNTYHVNNVSAHHDVVKGIGHLQEMIASEKDYIATRVAHKLNLKGPAISVHTACSTSLVAISQACLGLNGHQCDVALAGAASITSPVKSGHEFQEDGVFSKDGHTRTFSSLATGTTFSDGVGAVVLKRLDDAIASGDRIYAVIKSASVNNDGGGKMSFMAPSSEGQAAVIESAIRESGVPADSIGYVEAHGTATPVGDPIEIEGLRKAFGKFTDKKQFCAIGSVKSNFGHLTAAAGVVGVIKTALSIHHREIPASLNAEPVNPAINFVDSPFYPVTKRTPWNNSGQLRRAGVSSFGVGGTNAHAILEEYVAPVSVTSGAIAPELLLITAKSMNSLDRMTENLSTHVSKKMVSVSDAAHTLAHGRNFFDERRFIVTAKNQDHNQVAARFNELHSRYSGSSTYTGAPVKVAFMFPGQGCQYAGMAAELYEAESEFRQAVDICADLLQPLVQIDVRQLLLAKGNDLTSASSLIDETRYSQPCLFVMGYALYKLWASWGVTASAVIGHSVGELVAAHIAGVFSLEDALILVANRGGLMQELPRGSMVSVRLSIKDTESLLVEGISIAAINGATSCVVAGPHQQVGKFVERCEQQGIVHKILHTSHAFHSEMMEPAVLPFSAIVESTTRSPPIIPIMSTANASWLLGEQAVDPDYWGNHLRKTVRFAEGIQALWRDEDYVLVELGPRSTASTLAMQQVTDRKRQVAIPSLQLVHEDDSEVEALYTAVGRLWLTGCQIDHVAFRSKRLGEIQSLPCYPFEKNRHWLESEYSMMYAKAQGSVVPEHKASDSKPNHPSRVLGVGVQGRVKQVFFKSTDRMLDEDEVSVSFMALGMDSLTLIQFSNAIRDVFGFRPTMRQLMGDLESVARLATHIEVNYPEPDNIEGSKLSEGNSRKLQTEDRNAYSDDGSSASEIGVQDQVKQVFYKSTDRVLDEEDVSVSFMALGMDSLVLIQFSNAIRDVFGFRPTMRQLMGDLESVARLAEFIEENCSEMDSGRGCQFSDETGAAQSFTGSIETSDVDMDQTQMESAEFNLEKTVRAQLKMIQQQLEITNQQLDILSSLRKSRVSARLEKETVNALSDWEQESKLIREATIRHEPHRDTSNTDTKFVSKSHLGTRYRLKFGEDNFPIWEARDDRCDREFMEL